MPLWYVVRRVPLGQVGAALAAQARSSCLAGLATQLSVRAVNALRIRIIARSQGAPLSYQAILTALFTTAFYGLMLPGSLGAGAATLVKYVGLGATFAAALASMIVNRLLDTATIVALGLTFWGLDYRDAADAGQRHLAMAFLVLGPVLLGAFHLILFGRPRALRFVARALKRLELARRGAIGRAFENVVEQCAAAGNLPARDAVAVGALSIVKDLLAILVAYCFARATNVDLAFATVAWMQAIVSLLVLLPISLSGLGVREGALVLMTARHGVAAPLALTWSLLIFAGSLWVATIGGLIEAKGLWYRRETRASRD